ncbi:MAG: hypothetical protein ACREIW_05970, partial [Chthoniobacterales bacterium]
MKKIAIALFLVFVFFPAVSLSGAQNQKEPRFVEYVPANKDAKAFERVFVLENGVLTQNCTIAIRRGGRGVTVTVTEAGVPNGEYGVGDGFVQTISIRPHHWWQVWKKEIVVTSSTINHGKMVVVKGDRSWPAFNADGFDDIAKALPE